jgi:nucleotide-binding universal stress UspA family protein
MKKIEKLLIALDQSEQPEIIMNYGTTIAERYNSDITLLHILPSEIRYEEDAGSSVNEGDTGILPSPPSVKLAEAAYLQAYRWLESIALGSQKKNIITEIQVLVATDSVPVEILNYAEKNKIDLIIVGTKRRTGPESVLLGSVASHIITNAQCPILVVR